MIKEGNIVVGKALLKRAVLANWRNHLAWYNLAMIYNTQNKLNKALIYLQVANDIHPNWADGMYMLAMQYRSVMKVTSAVQTFEKILKSFPDHKACRINLAILYEQIGNFHKTIKTLAPLTKTGEDKLIPECANTLGLTLRELGLHKQSREYFYLHREKERVIWSNYLFMLNYDPDLAMEFVFEKHAEFGKSVGSSYKKIAADLKIPSRISSLPSLGEIVRVGFIGGDMREHSVSYFIEPIFREYDKSRIEIFVYHTNDTEDARSEHLRGLVGGDSHWRRLHNVNHIVGCEIILKDKIHVLIDLAGHTGGNRLDIIAMKPAPIQMLFVGYPNTTGLDAVDYMITDSVLRNHSDEMPAQLLVEKPLLIPGCFSCYMPPSYSNDVSPVKTEDPNGFVRIGTFTGISKINDRYLRLWAEIMHESPRVVLVLKSKLVHSKNMTVNYMVRMASLGIDISRVKLLEAQPTTSMHLSCYSTLDITLDTSPYSGTTTTCESLWMGTPVVTCIGNRHSGNTSASILAAVGLLENICRSEKEYINRVLFLVNNKEIRDGISGIKLRDMVRRS